MAGRRSWTAISPPDPGRLVEAAEIAVYEDLFRAAPPDFARRYRLGVDRAGGAVVFRMAGLPVLLFNRALGLGMETPATEAGLDAVLAALGAPGGGACAVAVAEPARPDALAAWLDARGFALRDRWIKFLRPVEVSSPDGRTGGAGDGAGDTGRASGPPGLRVEPVGPGDTETVSALLRAGFEMPRLLSPWQEAVVGRAGWRHFLVRIDGEPAAVGALYVNGPVAWLGMGCTAPGFRGRGAQGALLRRRLDAAAATGARWAVTEAVAPGPGEGPNPSHRNLLRAGFRPVHLRANWTPTGA